MTPVPGPDREAVVVIAGPTASGKSALALRIARTMTGVVINADSMQVYRELRILTGRPDEAALAAAPHRLYGVLPAGEPCSVGRWREMAVAAIREAHAAGRLPLVTGGTGLYLKALMEGLSPIPDIPPAVRQAARGRVAAAGGPAILEELRRRDPDTAGDLRAGDSQRLARALEVLEATGRGLAGWRREQDHSDAPGWRFFTILLAPAREALYAACDARLLRMIEAGAGAEAAALAGTDPALPAMKALGVPELCAHARGEIDLEHAVGKAQRATRNYAKRQMTWFRHQIAPDLTIDAQLSESVVAGIFSEIRRFLLTPDS